MAASDPLAEGDVDDQHDEAGNAETEQDKHGGGPADRHMPAAPLSAVRPVDFETESAQET